jgi:hypothetical protein
MAEVNYISPSSIMPQLGQVNVPGLSGWMLGNQERDYRDTMDLQKMLGGIGAQKAQLSLEEQIRDLPLKEAQRIRDIQDAGLTTKYAPELKELFAKDKRRTDTKEESTLLSGIDRINSDNRQHKTKSEIEDYDQRIQSVLSLQGLLENSGDDPTAKMAVLEHAQKLGMSPEDKVFQHLSKAGSSSDLADRLKGIEKHFRQRKDSIYQTESKLATQNEQLQSKLDNQRTLTELLIRGRADVGTARNASAERIAQINARAKAEAVKQVMPSLSQLQAQMIQQGDVKGAQELATLQARVRQAGSLTPVATFLGMQEFNKLPPNERTPEKQAEFIAKHLENFTKMEGVLSQRLMQQPQQQQQEGGAIGTLPRVPNPAQGDSNSPLLWSTESDIINEGTHPDGVPIWMRPPVQNTVPGSMAKESDALPWAVNNIPENNSILLHDMLKVYQGMPEGKPKEQMAIAIQEVKDRLSRDASGTSTGNTTPSATQTTVPTQTPMQGPANNPVNKKFEEFMKNRKKNEVPR